MSTIICKIGEIKATDKGEVIVKFTSTGGGEFADVMGMMGDLVAVSIEPVKQQQELPLDEDDETDADPAPAAAQPEIEYAQLNPGDEVTDADYEDIDEAAAEIGAGDEPTGCEPDLI